MAENVSKNNVFYNTRNIVRKDANGDILYPTAFFKIENVFEDEFKNLPEDIKPDYCYDKETRTYYVDNDAWANGWRAHGPFWRDETNPRYIDYSLGGSSVGCLVMGDLKKVIDENYGELPGTPFHSRAELYAEKKGIEYEVTDETDESIFRMGHVEEPSIRKEFPRIFKEDYPHLNVEVINDTTMYTCEHVPYAIVNLDGKVVIDGVEGIFEAKTVRFSSKNYPIWKSGRVPLDYYVQCQWYMEVMNKSFAIICVKYGMDEYDYFIIVRDLEICDALIKAANEFMDCLVNNVEPDESTEDIDLIYKLWIKRMGKYNYEEGNNSFVDLPKEKMSVLTELNSLNYQIEEEEKFVEELKTKRKEILVSEICPLVGKSNFAVCKNDDVFMSIKLKNSSSYRKKLNEEKLKEEHPDLYDKYVEMKPSFDSKAFKKENVNIYNEYLEQNAKMSSAKQNYCEITVKDIKKEEN